MFLQYFKNNIKTFVTCEFLFRNHEKICKKNRFFIASILFHQFSLYFFSLRVHEVFFFVVFFIFIFCLIHLHDFFSVFLHVNGNSNSAFDFSSFDFFLGGGRKLLLILLLSSFSFFLSFFLSFYLAFFFFFLSSVRPSVRPSAFIFEQRIWLFLRVKCYRSIP